MSLFRMILSPSQWFSIRPPELELTTAFALVVGAMIAIIVGVWLLFRAKRNRYDDKLKARGFNQLATWFIFWGFVKLAWTFFAYERIQLFGGFFWIPISVIIALVWLAFIIRYFKKTVPRLSAEAAKRVEREKYLPKAKR